MRNNSLHLPIEISYFLMYNVVASGPVLRGGKNVNPYVVPSKAKGSGSGWVCGHRHCGCHRRSSCGHPFQWADLQSFHCSREHYWNIVLASINNQDNLPIKSIPIFQEENKNVNTDVVPTKGKWPGSGRVCDHRHCGRHRRSNGWHPFQRADQESFHCSGEHYWHIVLNDKTSRVFTRR